MESRQMMTPDHPRWAEFVEQLSRTLICARTTHNAHRLLVTLGRFDVSASLEALRLLGARCDCEIVYELGHVEERAHA